MGTRWPAISAPLGGRGGRTGRHRSGGGRAGSCFPRHAGIGRAGTFAAGHAAAVWVAGQVSRDAMVACDPGMCRALQAQGFPAGNLLVLRPGAAGLRFCDVFVATRAVRHLLGSRFQQETAPAVIAGFGSGETRIDVRAVARGGAAAYRSALAADWAARRMAAAVLVKSPRVHAGAAARQELLTGKVNSRLLIMLAALAVSQPVNVVAFGDSAPGASAGMPLREMEVSAWAAGRPGLPSYSACALWCSRSMLCSCPRT